MIPLVQIEPADAPLKGRSPPATYDNYLRAYADSVRRFGHSVVIGFGREMNAAWYPWDYTRTPGSHVRGGVAAHRDAVPRAGGRQRHLAVDHPGGTAQGTGRSLSWWPGANYVTWVGIDGFTPSRPTPSTAFSSRPLIRCGHFTGKPILLPRPPWRASRAPRSNIINLFTGVVRYKMLGLVWLDKDQSRQATPRGDPRVAHQDWRLEDSPQAEQAFRLGVSGLKVAQP